MPQTATRCYEVFAPADGSILVEVPLEPKSEIAKKLTRIESSKTRVNPADVQPFLDRLRVRLQANRGKLIEIMQAETGFITRDTEEIVDSSIEFLQDFETYATEQVDRRQIVRHSYSSSVGRDMLVIQRPCRCVAAVVPQNASLTLSIIIIASALYAGSKVILRPALQCSASGAILSDLVMESDPPAGSVTFTNCLAKDFLEACCESDAVDVIHYIGSNQYALSVLNKSFEAGKTCLLDGQGNGLLYVDETFPLGEAVEIIASGSTRYNGETCTSINGVLIAPPVYEELKEALTARFEQFITGDPKDERTDIGPLFSARQALEFRSGLLDQGSHKLLVGGDIDGAYVRPAVVVGVKHTDIMAMQGFFGPAVWIASSSLDEVSTWLSSNQFPLSDTVLSRDPAVMRHFAAITHAARVCINQDPSIESMFEPWGGYPPSGLNPVSVWIDKYKRTFQVDGRLTDLTNMRMNGTDRG
ncbi:MAG: aldehyde dehydrogenase [Candidatus Eisenbacteria bacterium]|uniref:Aldehyde dehydrogenase n=1 Tax=Eiseniibacteriota bacterium TaxID=2212470 RepID=A0A956NA98_UNCEI|nr:aldehyde dehydrogenase [Candidatus Eisenbacteria bacterium]